MGWSTQAAYSSAEATLMKQAQTHPGRLLLVFGGLAIAYGLALGPGLNWLLGRDTRPGLCIVCVAVGLLAGVCGLGRLKGWSRH